MLIKFFKRLPKRTNGGKGGSHRASMDYLLNKSEGEVRVLQGNPELSVGLAEAIARGIERTNETTKRELLKSCLNELE